MNWRFLFSIFCVLICVTPVHSKPDDWIFIRQLNDQSLLYGQKQFIGRNGWIVGRHADKGGLIMQTTDGGRTWSEQFIKPSDDDERFGFHALHFINTQEGWSSGGGSYDIETGGFKAKSLVYHTNDGGVSWQPLPLVIENNPFTSRGIDTIRFTRIFFVNSQVGWMTAESDGIALVGQHAEPAIRFALLRTFDGGRTWTAQHQNIPILADANLLFFNSGEGWLIGNNVLYYTIDQGNTWTQVCFPKSGLEPCWSVSSITFLGLTEGWVMGHDTVHYTRDRGITWETRRHDLRGAPVHGSFWNGKDGWMTTSDGKLYHTPDGGNTWQMLSDGGLGTPIVAFGQAHYLPLDGRIIASAPFGFLLMYAQPVVAVEPAGKLTTTWSEIKANR
jgi:photosystem II stability/assembly factor-like uncharacterized protein